jgi:hypothetical protein
MTHLIYFAFWWRNERNYKSGKHWNGIWFNLYPTIKIPIVPNWFHAMKSHNDYWTSILTPWRWALLEKPPVLQLLKNFPAFNGTRRFITVVPILSQINPVYTSPSYPLYDYPHTYVLVFLVVSFLLAFPPISYIHSASPPFVLHALPISSSLT